MDHSLTRLWLFVISIPVAYCILVAAALPFRGKASELPSATFPIALLIAIFAVDWVLLRFVSKGEMNWKKRTALFCLLIGSVALASVLASLGPTI